MARAAHRRVSDRLGRGRCRPCTAPSRPLPRLDRRSARWRAVGAAVELSAADGRVVRARACVVTVPLSVLQRGEPEFRPPLPPPQAGAIRKLKMGSALKVIVRLRRRFWPADFYDAVCSDSFLPEVWLSPAAELMRPDAAPPYTIVGFVAGARAERVGRLPHADIAHRMLAQLDGMFGSGDDPHPASSTATASSSRTGPPTPTSTAPTRTRRAARMARGPRWGRRRTAASSSRARRATPASTRASTARWRRESRRCWSSLQPQSRSRL